MSSITVKKANVVLEVPYELKDRYLQSGYSIINTVTGAVIESALPSTPAEFKLELAKLKSGYNELYQDKMTCVALKEAEIKELKNEIKKLRAEIKKLKA